MKLEAEQIRNPVTRAALIDTIDYTGKLRIACFNVKLLVPNSSEEEIEIVLARLPIGRIRILGDLSLVEAHIASDLEYICVGWFPYKVYLQGKVAGEPEGFNKKKKATLFKLGTACPARTKAFNSQEGLYISMHLKGKISAKDMITGYIVYIKD